MQYMGEVGANFEVYRNDEITVEEIKKLVAVPSYIKSYMLISLNKKIHLQHVACSAGFLREEYLSPQALVSVFLTNSLINFVFTN